MELIHNTTRVVIQSNQKPLLGEDDEELDTSQGNFDKMKETNRLAAKRVYLWFFRKICG